MSDPTRIAVLSLACRFPDASTPEALWQNVLRGHRSFRMLPPERLALDAYGADVVGESLSITPVLAGLITDWEFDRARYRVPKSSYEAADLVHWLALETAARALEALPREGLPSQRTAVIVGNTLTGEFSRASQVHLRLPYLQQRLGGALRTAGVEDPLAQEVIRELSHAISRDFPVPTEETLAGGLANTIAGRIANHFDLHGGAWTVDGACAASLLAVVDACTRLQDGSVDAAIVGGVDLSLDPFELVGFSRNGALAKDQMRVFDRRANGFWPGEGCGFVVLAREGTPLANACEPLAYIAGWGVSTDGAGGLTRPTSSGQTTALLRAYARAQIDPANVGYVEAHGTGTAIGDPTEVRALAEVIGQPGQAVPIGSVKANIGHAKGAAGIAGLIKTVMGIEQGIVPPHVSCEEPHSVFAETGDRLRPARTPERWPSSTVGRVGGVSGFGFGGVNAHVVLTRAPNRVERLARVPAPVPSQTSELFVFAAADASGLAEQLGKLKEAAAHISLGQLGALAAHQWQHVGRGRCRAWLIASRPNQLVDRLERLADQLAKGGGSASAPTPSSTFGWASTQQPPRVGFLFPGQAAPVRLSGGHWARRFSDVRETLNALTPTDDRPATDTSVAQPAIVAASRSALDLVTAMGVEAEVAVGHSLGEILALTWAGAIRREDVMSLALARGEAMGSSASGGAMVRVVCSAGEACTAAAPFALTLACYNGPAESVMAGPKERCEAFVAEQVAMGREATLLPVSDAFHSTAMEGAAVALGEALQRFEFGGVERCVQSTVRGRELARDEPIVPLLLDQLTTPVRFSDAVAAAQVDFWLELGPGAGLSRLVSALGQDALSVDAFEESLDGLQRSLGVLWAKGASIALGQLFDDRSLVPIDIDARPQTLRNPCALAEHDELAVAALAPMRDAAAEREALAPEGATPLTCVISVVAQELDLPTEAVLPELRFLDDLHMNSLAVARIAQSAAQSLGVRVPAAVTDFANASIAELADQLGEISSFAQGEEQPDRYEGVAPWIESYAFRWVYSEVPDESCKGGWAVEGVGPGAGAGWARDLPSVNGLDDEDDARLVLELPLDADASEEQWSVALADLWRATQDALARKVPCLAVVHRGAPVMAWARSLVLEKQFESVVEVEVGDEATAWESVARVLRGVQPGFSSWRLQGERLFKRELRRLPPANMRANALHTGDLVVVSGGAKGIGAECSLRLAERFGVRLALLGRSPESHLDVRATLTRAAALGIEARYFAVDITQGDDVKRTIDRVKALMGPASAVLHAAGINDPAPFDRIDESTFARTMAVKVGGLNALLDALADDPPSVVIAFGSIIGALGLAGETHYALANAAQTQLLERYSRRSLGTRTLSFEWSVWATTGMGERLGTLDRLLNEGVHALPLDRALDAFEGLVASDAAGARVVTNRFGRSADIDLGHAPLPLHRFMETERVSYPGLELVVDAQLSRGSDPYLEDHMVDGQALLPGVMMLEAMAAAALVLQSPAQAITGDGLDRRIQFEDVRFDRPITLPERASLTVRIAALMGADGQVTVHLRSSADAFASICAQARVAIRSAPPSGESVSTPALSRSRPAIADIDASPLYRQQLFFNGGRFQRVGRYQSLGSRELLAVLAPAPSGESWFGTYLPQETLLGDPGARDAGLHALQACVPQRRVVPVSVEHVQVLHAQSPRARVEAVQRWADRSQFVFDLQYFDDQDRLVEIWEGVRFSAISELSTEALPEAMVDVWLERELALRTGRDDLLVAVAHGEDRHQRRSRACSHLGIVDPKHTGDGRTLLRDGQEQGKVSLGHCPNLTLLVGAEGSVGCELALWDPGDRAAEVPIWCAREALRKVGVSVPDLRALASVPPEKLFARSWDVSGFGVFLFRLPRHVVAICLGPRAQSLKPPPVNGHAVEPSAPMSRAPRTARALT